MSTRRVVIVGGGAAGFFAAIACARAGKPVDVRIFERGPEFLAKVRISGGGRCNLTNACFDPAKLAVAYPRGSRELLGAFHRFQPADTMTWFEERGVHLKIEADTRVFPSSDRAASVVDCLTNQARSAGVALHSRLGVSAIEPKAGGGFRLMLSNAAQTECDAVLLATGGCRNPAASRLAAMLGHRIEAPVPSLFSFHIDEPWLRALAGITVDDVIVAVPGTTLNERGPMLVTHWGLSGPAVLRLSAWGARALHGRKYRFPLAIRWLPMLSEEMIGAEISRRRQHQPGRTVANTPLAPLPSRLWKALVTAAGIAPGVSWHQLSRTLARTLTQKLTRDSLPVSGKSLNKEEFVTCGGVCLRDVDFRSMESRVQPGLFLAGELLDIDGITGGFNFQAAWTTGWIAGHAMAGVSVP